MKIGFGVWVVLLIAEIIWFSSILVSPHSMESILFIITIIITTLTAGSVGLFVFNKK